MSSTRFQKICREISQFSEKIEITCVGNQLIFKGCNECASQEIRIKPSANGMSFEQNSPDEIVQGVFKLKHLFNLVNVLIFPLIFVFLFVMIILLYYIVILLVLDL